MLALIAQQAKKRIKFYPQKLRVYKFSINLLKHMQRLWSWGWAFKLKYDSLLRLGFKGDVCMVITDPPVAKLAYKIEHQSLS
jgi:hypothetical protein